MPALRIALLQMTSGIDADAIAHPRELNRIRDELAAERAAHADTRAALAALKALGPEEPPF